MTAPREMDEGKLRFQVELEFVQCLANPNYLTFLAQRGYFKENYFINYLKYLLYWKEPEYAKYLKYPQCLHFLELLQYEHFRRELMNAQCAKFIDDQQLLHWQHYQRKRMRLIQEQADKVSGGSSGNTATLQNSTGPPPPTQMAAPPPMSNQMPQMGGGIPGLPQQVLK